MLTFVSAPVTCASLIAISVVFILDWFILPGKENKRFSLRILKLQASYGPVFNALCMNTSDVKHGQIWRLLSSALLHSGFFHILFNAIAVISVGPAVEHSIGSLRTLAVMIAAAMFANICDIVVLEHEGGNGFSGSIFGLIAVFTVLWFQNREAMLAAASFPARLFILVYALACLWPDKANYVEHGGAFVAGIVLAAVFMIL